MVLNFVYSSKPTLTWGSCAIKLPYLKVTGLSLSNPQKVILISVSIGIGVVAVLSRYLKRSKRKRASLTSKNDTVLLNRKLHSGIRSPNGDGLTGFPTINQISFPSRYRTRSTSVNSDRYSVSESVDLQSPLSPQQLRALGVESLEVAIDYWEDALAAFQSNSGVAALLASEETEFCRSLERVLKAAYVLREHLFSQHSGEFHSDAAALVDSAPSFSRSTFSLAVSDADSFASALDDIGDLDDFELAIDDSLPRLYQGSMKQLDEHGIPCRVLRTQLVNCQNDIEYLCKLHCIRLACQGMFHQDETKQWFIREGRSLLCDLLTLAERDEDVSQLTVAFDAMIQFVEDDSQRYKMAEEMEQRGVKSLTFFDVVLDFILMDSFEDITDPPPTVLAVIGNRWLSYGVKERAIRNAVWMILRAKRRRLKYPDGFMSHFYAISEHLSPVLAMGFLGPESNLKRSCIFFKEQVEGFLADLFNFEQVNYSTVEDMLSDVWTLAKHRREAIAQQMDSLLIH